jgi:CBS domain-containing protein
MNILFFLTPKNEVAFVDEKDMVRQVLEKMEVSGYTAVPLLAEDGKYIGTITEGDLLWELRARNFPTLKKMEEISILQIPRKRDNKPVNVQTDMEELMVKAMKQNFVPVVDDDNVFIGIVTRKEIIQYLCKKQKNI